MRVSRTVSAPVLIIMCLLSIGPLRAASPRRAFDDLVAQATAAQRAARWDDAFRLWKQAHALAPDAVMPSYGTATAAAQLGKSDEAYAWLERAVASGFDSANLASLDENLAELRDDPRWAGLLAKMQEATTQAIARVQVPRQELDVSTAPVFKSYSKLAAAFDRRSRQLDADSWLMSQTAQAEARFRLNDERIGAVHRYLQEHPVAKDSGDAAWDAASHRITILYPFYLRPAWGAAGQQVVRDLDSFILNYPGSLHRGEALTYRAFAVFHIRDEGESQDRPWTPGDLRKLDESLGEVAQTFAGTTPGGLALAWRLVVADISSVETITPAMYAMRAELEQRYSTDRAVQDMLATEGRAAIVRIDGIETFEATDLAGTKWDRAAFAGRITLIDFWATWCVPCILEIPTLRQAWVDFHENGFQILGVSLDSDPRQVFESWLKANSVAWPQVWDGKGWDSPLVRRFRVRGVPFVVLLDRDGRVVNVDLRGDALLGRIKELVHANNRGSVQSPANAP